MKSKTRKRDPRKRSQAAKVERTQVVRRLTATEVAMHERRYQRRFGGINAGLRAIVYVEEFDVGGAV